jgi:hypothetical protein
MQGDRGEGMFCTHACAAEREPNRGRRCSRVGRDAESQQQAGGSLSCKFFVSCDHLFVAGGRCRERKERGWAALTRVLQSNNRIGDDGARGLGEGLRVNSSLKMLYLVSFFVFFVF